MKVVLLSDVRKVGRKGEVREVAEGYARNFLLANKLAEVATPAVLARLKQQEDKRKVDTKLAQAHWEQVARKLAEKPLTIKAKAAAGNLFGSIGPKELTAHLAKEGINLEEKVFGKTHLRTLGEHRLEVVLGGAVKAVFKIIVEESEK
ncbi:MAG TPA: 50S ribosomal protein L9 [Candidatus Moranbacteria bacterium]|nr:50S ribosomal protein L9 [Candidatus Moranbacteria bacterium]